MEDIQYTKARLGTSLKEEWESKATHDHYIRSIQRWLMSEEDMFLSPLGEGRSERRTMSTIFSERVEHINISMPNIGRRIPKQAR
jgi:hypothetical protein